MANQARNVVIDDELWQRLSRASLRDGMREGRQLSRSEWLRRAAEEKLARDGEE